MPYLTGAYIDGPLVTLKDFVSSFRKSVGETKAEHETFVGGLTENMIRDDTRMGIGGTVDEVDAATRRLNEVSRYKRYNDGNLTSFINDVNTAMSSSDNTGYSHDAKRILVNELNAFIMEWETMDSKFTKWEKTFQGELEKVTL